MRSTKFTKRILKEREACMFRNCWKEKEIERKKHLNVREREGFYGNGE